MIFDDLWDEDLVLKPDGNIEKKIRLVRDFFETAWEKNNHFDKLRQQHLNYALIAFSGLLAFVIKGDDILLQCTGCLGIALLMVAFCVHDHRLHRYTHGFSAATLLHAKALADLTNDAKCEVSVRLYMRDAEKEARFMKSLHSRVYSVLAIAAIFLGLILFARSQVS